jgi:hypothetical protein
MFVFEPALVFVLVCEFEFEEESEVDVVDCLRMRAFDADETGIARVDGARRRRHRKAETLGVCILKDCSWLCCMCVCVSVLEGNIDREPYGMEIETDEVGLQGKCRLKERLESDCKVKSEL